MDDAFRDGCGDNQDHECPICRGEMSDEFIERMKAAVAQPGRTMTVKEASDWLRKL